jgi:hypothetical protein
MHTLIRNHNNNETPVVFQQILLLQIDTVANILEAINLRVQKRSEIFSFSKIRKSCCISQFAASFFDSRVESSIDETFQFFRFSSKSLGRRDKSITV